MSLLEGTSSAESGCKRRSSLKRDELWKMQGIFYENSRKTSSKFATQILGKRCFP